MAIPTNGLVFYAPLAEDKATAETGQTLTKSGTVNTLKINNIPCSLFASENSNLYANYSGGAFNGTISLWLYATDNTRSDTTDYGGFFMLGDFGNFSFIKGCMNTSAENSFSFGSSNINSSHCYPSTTIIRNEWVHLCFVVSGTSYSIYKNGILASQATAASAITLPDEATLYINNSEVGGIENIAIAACRVYNRVLTNDEITELSKEFADEGTSGGTGVVINGLFLSTSKPTAGDKGLLINNKFFIPFAESSGSGGTSAEYYKCASVDVSAKIWSGYKAVQQENGGYTFEETVTTGLAYTSVTPTVGGIYSADALVIVTSLWNGAPSYASIFDSICTTIQTNADVTTTTSATTFGSLSSASDKWRGGVLASNGKIYGIPCNSSSVLEINPVTQTATTFGILSSASDKWRGGVLAPNGKIYGIPCYSSSVLEIDPVTQTATMFGSLDGDAKWIGGVLAPNGKIYGIPCNSASVLEIDPFTQTTTTFGSLSGTNKWIGGVLAPNGKIYGIPCNSASVLEIDPVTQTATMFGSLSSASNKWRGGVLAPNGKIYGIPYSSSSVLEIDPVTQTATTFGSLDGDAKWIGGVLAPNGKIYGIPCNSASVLEIDPFTQTTTTFGSLSGTNKWIGGVLAPNGKIYGIPCNSASVLEISIGSGFTNFSDTALQSSYLNKY